MVLTLDSRVKVFERSLFLGCTLVILILVGNVFKMYVPFQDATLVPVSFDPGTYTRADVTLPQLDAIGAKDSSGKLWLEITNLDPNQPVEVDANVVGLNAKAATGQTLTAPKVDSINTFDAPNTAGSKPFSAKAQNGKLILNLQPKSVTVVSVE